MCKTRFGSQGLILDGFEAKKNEKNINGTRGPTPPPSWQMPLKISIFLFNLPLSHLFPPFDVDHIRGTFDFAKILAVIFSSL